MPERSVAVGAVPDPARGWRVHGLAGPGQAIAILMRPPEERIRRQGARHSHAAMPASGGPSTITSTASRDSFAKARQSATSAMLS